MLGATLAFGAWFALVTWRLSRLHQSQDRLEQYLFGIFTAACVVTTTSLLMYFTLPFQTSSLAVGFTILTLGIALVPLPPVAPTTSGSGDRLPWPWLALGVLLVTQGSLLALLCVGRTDEPLVSPWLLFPSSVFVLFFISTLLCAYIGTQIGKRVLPFASLQMFLALGVSAIVYQIGFGFDPFIHRAAEQALIATGSIEPTSLLYSGQYAVIGFLHYVTSLPISIIDIWLLPIGASLLLPISAYVGLRYGWGVREEVASLGWLAVLFIPFMLLTFTVPFTIAYAIFVAMLFLFPLVRSTAWWLILCWISTLSIFFHPLLGVPTFVLVFCAGCYERARTSVQRGIMLIALLLATCVGVTGLLIFYQYQAGVSVSLHGLWMNSFSFLSLFVNPFNNYHPSIRWEYHFLYLWRYWQPVLLTVFGWPLALLFARHRFRQLLPLCAFALGLLGCMYAVSTLFVFEGIISHEQHEFALRLLQSWYLIPIPFIALALDRIMLSQWRFTVAIVLLTIAATAAWYFSYPQFNAKFAYYSPSVSKYDLTAVQLIDTDSGRHPYLVLSNQMTSAAALQVFGFANYYSLEDEEILWYAIPTGGPLYEYYLKMIYGNDPALLQDLMRETGTQYVYVVMPTYWSWNPDILHQIEVQSQQIFYVDNKIVIYRFDYANTSGHKNTGANFN